MKEQKATKAQLLFAGVEPARQLRLTGVALAYGIFQYFYWGFVFSKP